MIEVKVNIFFKRKYIFSKSSGREIELIKSLSQELVKPTNDSQILAP